MSGLRIPLSVRLTTSTEPGLTLADKHVTGELRDLDFDAGAPGGFRSAKLSLHRALDVRHDEIRRYGRVYVYDQAGEIMFNGRLEDPARNAGPDGQIYALTAIGPAGHARDRKVPVIYADTAHASMITATGSGRAYDVGSRESSTAPDGALSISARQGNVLSVGSLGAAVYDHLYNAGLGQGLARVSVDWDGGFSSSNTKVELRSAQDLGATTTLLSVDISTTGGTLTASLGGGTAIPSGHNRFLLVSRRSAAGITVADDNYWTEFSGLHVLGTRFDAAGNPIVSGYNANTVFAHEVVADLLGRLLTEFDGANATIATNSYAIDKLAYYDGAHSEKILSDLMALETGYYWAAWEGPNGAPYRFEWIAWPSTVRFEADIADGFDSPGSGEELFNRARVRYRTAAGQIATRQRSLAVPDLDNAGLIREELLDLGDEVGSAANADRAGDEFLAEHQYAPNRGTLTIARPLFDRQLGRLLMPWELPRRAPGALIRVRGVAPNINALNPSSRDGVTVFRVVSASFNAGSCRARLELDAQHLSLPRIIAPIIRPPTVRRR